MYAYTEVKLKDFQNYFRLTSHRVEYNGAVYLILDDEDNTVTQGQTNEEIYSYIIGFLNSHKIQEKRIKELEESLKSISKINQNNIERYEEIIKGMGGETITE
jgi:hypothetical protein